MSLETRIDKYHTAYEETFNYFSKIFVVPINKLEDNSVKSLSLLLALMYAIANDRRAMSEDEKIALCSTELAKIREIPLSKFFAEYKDRFAAPIEYVDYATISQVKRHLLTTNLTITPTFKSIKALIEHSYLLQYNKITPKKKIIVVEPIALPYWLEQYIIERFDATYFYIWPEN